MNSKRELKFVSIDDWNRAVFKDQFGNFFGNVDILFDYGDTAETVAKKVTENNMQYFGRSFDDDPYGTFMKPDKIKIVKEFNFKNEQIN